MGVAGVLALAFHAVLVTYLWRVQKSDLMHWVSLVLVPLGIVVLGTSAVRGRLAVRESLAAVGLGRHGWGEGLGFAALLGLAASVAQLAFSDRCEEIWSVVSSGRILVYLPLVLVLLLVTAAFTEELFFRGVLQARLADWWRSDVAALLVAAALFGLYHFPYAYLDPDWSTHGDVPAALAECGWSAPAGVLLGYVYGRAHRNLMASVVCHAMVDALPAMTMVHFAIRFGG